MASKSTATGMEVAINMHLVKAIERIPITLRNGPLGRCLKKFGDPIAKASPGLAKSSRKTGTRLKWSKKYKNNPAWQIDSGNYYGTKVPKHGLAVIVGAKYKQGNKQQFVMPFKKGDSYEHVQWGKRVEGRMIRFPMEERAPRRAFNQTKMAAAHAYITQLRKELEELRLG